MIQIIYNKNLQEREVIQAQGVFDSLDLLNMLNDKVKSIDN